MSESETDDRPPQGRHQLQADHDAIYVPEELAGRRLRWIGGGLSIVTLAIVAFLLCVRGEMFRIDRVLLSSMPAMDRLILDPTPPGLDGYDWPGTRVSRVAATLSPARYLLRAEKATFDVQSPRGYRLVGILLHAASAVALVAIAQRLSLRWAWPIGVAYAVTPMAVGAIAVFVHQPPLLAILLGLLATLLYLRWSGIDRREADSPLRARLPESRPLLAAIGIPLWTAAVLAHPIAAAFPIVWGVLAGWRLGRVQSWAQAIALFLMAMAAAAWGVAIRFALTGDAIGTTLADLARRVGLLPTAAWATVRLGLWSSPASLVGYPMSSLNALPVVIGGTIVAVVAAAWILRRRWPPALVAPIAGLASFVVLDYAAVACAPADAGEVGPYGATLLLPLAAVLIAATQPLAAALARWPSRRPARVDPDENDVDLAGGVIGWRQASLGLAAIVAALALALPAASQARDFATGERSLVDRDLARWPNSRRAADAAVASLAAGDRLFDAETIVARELDRSPQDVDWLLARAQLFALHQRYPEALKALSVINHLTSTDPRPYRLLGFILERRNQPDAADKAYRLGLAAAGTRPVPRLHAALGSLLLAGGKVEDALTEFRVTLAADPFSVEGLLGQARAQIARRDAAAADQTLVRLTTAYLQDPAVMTQVALTLAAAGDDANARRLLEYVVRPPARRRVPQQPWHATRPFRPPARGATPVRAGRATRREQRLSPAEPGRPASRHARGHAGRSIKPKRFAFPEQAISVRTRHVISGSSPCPIDRFASAAASRSRSPAAARCTPQSQWPFRCRWEWKTSTRSPRPARRVPSRGDGASSSLEAIC